MNVLYGANGLFPRLYRWVSPRWQRFWNWESCYVGHHTDFCRWTVYHQKRVLR